MRRRNTEQCKLCHPHTLYRAVSKQIETKNIKLYLINLISIGTLEDSREGERGTKGVGSKIKLGL